MAHYVSSYTELPISICMTYTTNLRRKGEPQNYMFGEMREALQIDTKIDILDHIHSLPEKEQREAFEKVQEIESKAMEKQVPQAGLVSLMEELDQHGIKKGICTRNFE